MEDGQTYQWRGSSAASSAPSGGGVGGEPGDWGSPWIPGLCEEARDPGDFQGDHV